MDFYGGERLTWNYSVYLWNKDSFFWQQKVFITRFDRNVVFSGRFLGTLSVFHVKHFRLSYLTDQINIKGV